MHPEVLIEVKDKIPSPVFKKSTGKSHENSIFKLKDGGSTKRIEIAKPI